MRHVKSRRFITETLSLQPNTGFLARELSQHIYRTYGHSASPKTISKLVNPLTDDYAQIHKLTHTNQQFAQTGCRYTYLWVNSGDTSIYSSTPP